MTGDFQQFRYRDTIPKRVKAARLVWSLVWAVAFRTSPRGAGHGWRRFLLRLFGARIGAGSKIAPSCFVWAPWNLEMGSLSVLGDGVDCYSMDKIVIGSKVAVSQRTFLCSGTHDTTSLLRPLRTKPIHLGDHAWICAEAFIGPGVTVGDGSVVGARSCVTKNVPPWIIVAGNPAREIRKRVITEE